MADEFAKGFAILTGGGMLWMAVSAWLTTESFEGTQLIAAPPEDPGTYAQLALFLRDITTWFIVFGVFAFWIAIPAAREIRDYLDEDADAA